MGNCEETDFWDAFTQLKAARLRSFFNVVMSKDEFISSILVVLDSESFRDAIRPSLEACEKLNAYVSGETLGSELQFVTYRDNEFIFHFFVTLRSVTSYSKMQDLYYHLTYPLAGTDYEVTPDTEESNHFKVSESEFWKDMKTRVKIEATFGTLKRDHRP